MQAGPNPPDDAAQTGRRRPTLADVARETGVSVSAVSFALNGRPGVSDALRARVLEAAQRLGYRPNRAAVALKTRRTGVIGVLVRNLRNPFFLDVIGGFERVCAARGYQVMIGSADYDRDREDSLVRTFADRAVDGLAIAPIGHSNAVARWRSLCRGPVVLVNAATHEASPEVLRVHPDGRAAVDLAVGHLAALGHRRVGLVAVTADASPDPERSELFLEAVRRRGLDGRVIETRIDPDGSVDAIAGALADRRRRPTAIMSNSDYVAWSAYDAARRLGLVVPDDVSVIGHDDLPTSPLLDPPLTTLRVDRVALGETAAGLLLDTLAGRPAERVVELPVQLVVRGSTAAPPGVHAEGDRATTDGVRSRAGGVPAPAGPSEPVA